ncbi:MAG: ATP-binding protein [Acidobacteria bacterium]|nr:ATP-binding protein [Acidobacteriota bacterium]
MSPETRRVEMTLETKIESMDLGEEVARRVAATAGFDEDERHKICMAVRECLINALQHGNRYDPRKPIGVTFTLLPDRLMVQVRDQGPGFDLAGIPDPLSDEHLLKSSGRGLFLVRCFMDELMVESGRNGGAVVTMIKRYSSNHRGAGESEAEKEKQR